MGMWMLLTMFKLTSLKILMSMKMIIVETVWNKNHQFSETMIFNKAINKPIATNKIDHKDIMMFLYITIAVELI